MGLIGQILGGGAREITQAVGDLADGFRPNATEARKLQHAAYLAALAQMGAEFEHAGTTRWDRFINGLNRLPRPMLALGTLGLFIFAMADPVRFSARMQGLALVPEPLWWLLGAIVGFYFGAREMHYARRPRPVKRQSPAKPSSNAALEAWRAERGG